MDTRSIVADKTDVLDLVEHVNSLVDFLHNADSSDICDTVKGQLNCLYEKLSYVVASWGVVNKSIINDYKIEESLWGDEYLLKYCFEDCVTCFPSKKGNKDDLFCMVCKEYMAYTHNNLVTHMNSISHLSKFNNFKSTATDTLWEDSHLLRYAFEKFIDLRNDSTLYCKLCGVVLHLTHFALLAHVNGSSHNEKFKEILNFRGRKQSHIPRNHRDKVIEEAYFPNVSTTPRSFIVKDGSKRIESHDNFVSTVKESNGNLSKEAAFVTVNCDLDKKKFQPNKTDKKKLFMVSQESIKFHNKYIFKLSKAGDNSKTINFFCEPCGQFDICSSVQAIDDHQNHSQHQNMVLLKQNISQANFNWYYCDVCNANLYCENELMVVHNQSDYHLQLSRMDMSKNTGAESAKGNYKLGSYTNGIPSNKQFNREKRNSSVEKKGTIIEKVNRFDKVLNQYISEAPNLEKWLSQVIEKNTFIAHYCLLCDYYSFFEKQWNFHIRCEGHCNKFKNNVETFAVYTCECRLNLICDDLFMKKHVKGYTHKRICKLVPSTLTSTGGTGEAKGMPFKTLSAAGRFETHSEDRQFVKPHNDNWKENSKAKIKMSRKQRKEANKIFSEENNPVEKLQLGTQCLSNCLDNGENTFSNRSDLKAESERSDLKGFSESSWNCEDLEKVFSTSKKDINNCVGKVKPDSLTGPQQFCLKGFSSDVSKQSITTAFSTCGKVISVDLVSPNSANISIILNDTSLQEYKNMGNLMIDVNNQYYEVKIV